MNRLLLVALGGALGSMGRYLVSGWVHRWLGVSSFPIGTLCVNLAGCLAIGFLGGLADVRQVLHPEARVFLLVGCLGGFTTFSSFGYETLNLLRDGQLAATMLNVGVQVMVGLAAVWAGLVLARLL